MVGGGLRLSPLVEDPAETLRGVTLPEACGLRGGLGVRSPPVAPPRGLRDPTAGSMPVAREGELFLGPCGLDGRACLPPPTAAEPGTFSEPDDAFWPVACELGVAGLEEVWPAVGALPGLPAVFGSLLSTGAILYKTFSFSSCVLSCIATVFSDT